MSTLYRTIVRPIVTEKTSVAMQDRGEYVFEVAPDASKPAIRQAIEQLFGVKVTAVNTLIRKGKNKRFRGVLGKTGDSKRAIVTLAEGQSIDVTTGL